MPFDEDNDDQPKKNVGLKNVSSQKSIFDSMPKKPTQDDLNKHVQMVEEKKDKYKSRMVDLTVKFSQIMKDSTLRENKTSFSKDFEKEILSQLIGLAQEINSDEEKVENEGSLALIMILLKVVLMQRDNINKLNYTVSELHNLIKKDNSK